MSDLIKWTPTTSPVIIEQEARELAERLETTEDCEKAISLVRALLKHPHFKKDKEAQKAMKRAAKWLERRAGELLKKGIRKPGETNKTIMYNNDTLSPTLSQLKIKRIESSKWQQIASIPEPQFKETISRTPTTAALLRVAKELKTHSWEHNPIVEAGDIREMQSLPCGPVDVILTDPPYGEEYLELYRLLAIVAASSLKEGGSLLCMTGQSYLPQIFELLKHPDLKYRWTFAYLTPGGQSPQIWPAKINTFWKPILWYVKGEYENEWNGDVIKSDLNDKAYHKWGQSTSGMKKLLERISNPEAIIADPFCGGGTTGYAAAESGRRFYGYDNDIEMVNIARKRLNA